MKTRFIKLFTVALAMSMAFVGCSNDDEKGPGAKDIQKEYAAEDVSVKFGDAVVDGATVNVTAVDDKNIVVTLNKVVAGFATFDVDAVVVPVTKAVEYAFAGEKTVGEMKISIAGTIVDGKMAVNVTNKITSSVVGDWTYYIRPTSGGSGSFESINFVYANKEDKSTYHLMSDSDKPAITGTNAEFCAETNTLINFAVMMAIQPLKITLTADGYISASATLMGNSVVADKAARYTYDSAKKILYISLPAEIAIFLGSDLALACEVIDGNLCAAVKYETLKPLIALLQLADANGDITNLIKQLLSENMQGNVTMFAGPINNLIDDIFTALKDKTTTNVELGLKFAKVVVKPTV